MLQTLIPSLILNAVNVELKNADNPCSVSFNGAGIVLTDGDGNDYPLTLDAVAKAIVRANSPERAEQYGADELAEAVAEKVLAKLTSPDYIVPIKIDPAALRAIAEAVRQ